MRLKILSLVAAGLLLSACETQKPTPPPMAGSTFNMPSSGAGKGSYQVMMDGKKKMFYESTDLDIISETAACCDKGQPKEVAILRTNRELEISVAGHTPNIMLEDIDVRCCDSSNASKLEVELRVKVLHGAGQNMNLPMVDVPFFFTAMDPATGEVYSHGHAMVKVDLNKPFESQRAIAWFDVSDLKARNLRGWSMITGIMKSYQNRKFEAEVAREKQHKIAEAAGPYDMNTKRTGSIAPALRGSEDSSTGLVVK